MRFVPKWARGLRRIVAPNLVGPLVALAALLVFNLLFTPSFGLEWRDGRLYGSAIDILKNGSPVVLLSVGMTLVIALGGIDLSVGSLMALSGAAGALMLTAHSASPVVAAVGGLAVAVAAGLFNGGLVALARIQPIVATLVMLVAARGIALTMTDNQKVRFESPAFEALARGDFLGLPTPVYIAAAVAALTALALRKTALGMAIEATGNNPRAAVLCGLRVRTITVATYAFSGLCAGMAGLIAAADIKEADVFAAGLYLELDAILAVVIGGTSLTGGRPRVFGAVLGALVMQTLTVTLLMHDVKPEYTLMVKGVAALGVCAAQAPVVAQFLRPRRGHRS
jgi:ribose/xylose/arabinose/galactoside ABC-type transport system permease subunit